MHKAVLQEFKSSLLLKIIKQFLLWRFVFSVFIKENLKKKKFNKRFETKVMKISQFSVCCGF